MAFWRKSDDPWDRKPEKRQETTWYEQDTPETEPAGADTIRPSERAEEAPPTSSFPGFSEPP